MSFKKKIQRFINREKLFSAEQKLLVAVSGGVDSMVLLHVLKELKYQIEVAHVNYQLRKKNSDLDEALVADYCNANELKLHILKPEINSERSVQEQARKVRYEWFSELCKENELLRVITAHHKDDQAETLLFKLCRGTGLTGAGAMRAMSGDVVHPFLNVSKEEIEFYAAQNHIPFRMDLSNESLKYSRNRIRHNIIPELCSVNSMATEHLADFTAIAQEAESLAKDMALRTWESNSVKAEIGFKLQLAEWASKKHSRLLLHYMLEILGEDPERTAEVFKLLESESGKKVESNQFVYWKNRQELIIERPVQTASEKVELLVFEPGKFKAGNLWFTAEIIPVPKTLKTGANCVLLDVEKINWPLKIRNWKHGDSIRPFGMNGKQKVSDILIQKKLSAPEKAKILVMETDENIFWVIGVRSSEFTRVSGKNKKVLKILITV